MTAVVHNLGRISLVVVLACSSSLAGIVLFGPPGGLPEQTAAFQTAIGSLLVFIVIGTFAAGLALIASPQRKSAGVALFVGLLFGVIWMIGLPVGIAETR